MGVLWESVRFRAEQRAKHSSLQLTKTHYSSQPTVSQLKCVPDTISNWFENHQPQKTKISTVTNAPFIQNSNQMAYKLTAATSFPTVFFQLLQFSRRQRPSFSAHRAAVMTKTNLNFPAFSLKFVGFAVQFCFRCKFSFQVWQYSVIFLDQSQFFAAHSNQWDFFICIDNGLRQTAFFVLAGVGKGRISRYVEVFWNKQQLYE